MRGRVKAAAPGAGLASQPRRDPRAPLMVLPLTLIVGGSSDRAPCVLTAGSGPGLARLQVLSVSVRVCETPRHKQVLNKPDPPQLRCRPLSHRSCVTGFPGGARGRGARGALSSGRSGLEKVPGAKRC